MYLEFCSPEQPSLSGLDLLTDYLAWFFLLNDLPVGPEKRGQLAEARDVFHGKPSNGSLVATATAEFCQTIRERFSLDERARLERRLSDMLEALCWEAEQSTHRPPAPELFSIFREHTIADYPYLELWRLGEGLIVDTRHWPIFTELERINARIIYLTNDLLSSARDQRLDKLNTLFCLMNARRISLEQAGALLHHELYRLVECFASLADSVKREDETRASAVTYISFLGSNLEGNRLTMFALADRYRLAGSSR